MDFGLNLGCGSGSNLAFLVSDKPSFNLPLSSIANSNIAGKTEVSLEITPPVAPPVVSGGGKTRQRAVDELVELRFFIPGKIGDSGSESEGEGEDVSRAQAFHDMIKERAEISEGGGEGVVVFNEVLVLTPRGRYDIDMFLTHFRLRGKTYDYKIMHSSVTRLFLLPKADEIHVQLVVRGMCFFFLFLWRACVCSEKKLFDETGRSGPCDPTRSDPIPVPRPPIHQRRRDGRRAQPNRVCPS